MLHIVDDEVDVQNVIKWMAEARELRTRTYSSAKEFFEALNLMSKKGNDWVEGSVSDLLLDPEGDCVLMDVRMPGMSGMAAFDVIVRKNLCKRIPVIFITAYGEIQMAIDAFKRGAFDFFEKPFNDINLFKRVDEALSLSKLESEIDGIRGKLETLTVREHEILGLILNGKMNKAIATQLGISLRTVEVHRANIMEKLAVKSAMELVNLVK